jgi:hypothetical protein
MHTSWLNLFGENTEVDFLIGTIEILCTEDHFLGMYINESLKVKNIIASPQKLYWWHWRGRTIIYEIMSELNYSHGKRHYKNGLRSNQNILFWFDLEICGLLDQMLWKVSDYIEKEDGSNYCGMSKFIMRFLFFT